MRIVAQRVSRAEVSVDGKTVGSIGSGLLLLIGVGKDDTELSVEYMLDKALALRVFEDQDGRMNRNVVEAGGSLLLVSQFTLYGDVRKGRRPSFDAAAAPEKARALYDLFLDKARSRGIPVSAGVFRAHMQVTLTNSGPVTILIDSERSF